ncbi:acetoacetate--CoA ligase [Pseudomonas sp. AM8]|uniref:acetoacetate--CoA ligase n=1 Tax=Pseudomonas sp. AM8 TaxID=2983368 RepID=UPI002E811D46|nr:acetoacetate--CoA ligase [Pseudomonas sp. AM8]
MIEEGHFLWQADRERLGKANISRYMSWLSTHRGHDFDSYSDLWKWSIADPDAFWQSIWDHFDLIYDGQINEVRTADPMPKTRWFTGTRLNYAEHILRNELKGDPARPFLQHCSELRPLQSLSWTEVASQVRRLASRLRDMGVKPGDRVVAYMPNIPEAVIAMLATTAIGATWSSAAPEFGAQTVIDRFSQIGPKIVFAANGYRYGGKDFDRSGQIANIVALLPTVEQVIWLDYLDGAGDGSNLSVPLISWEGTIGGPEVRAEDFSYERVASDHPLWVLFSSGTTGLPKAIVHSHQGILLEHYKSAAFHFEIQEGDCLCFYSTTGWMMWNTLMQGPMMNAQVVLYDGHPTHPSPDFLWELVDASGATLFGTNPTFLQILRDSGYFPKAHHILTRLKSLTLIGSPATPEIFAWCYDAIKSELWVSSQSGGTEFCSGLLGGTELLAVRAGEIQSRCLGVAAYAYDDQGRQVIDQSGELVIKQAMPSMPIFLWGDEDGTRYNDSYFTLYPGIWQHGDLVKFKQHGGCFVYGRSDATLNRFGVRIGSAEIYRTLETFQEIVDSLIVCIETGKGGYYMPLFVVLREGYTLDEAMVSDIKTRLRNERSPRHVPDEIHAVPAIPMTLTGKKMEIPVRKLLMGERLQAVISPGAMRDPAILEWYVDFGRCYRQKKS